MLKYTICFIKCDDEILMLNREKNPNMGLWNGVGGKIEQGETHLQSVIREAYEETGIQLNNPTFAGEVVWLSNQGNGGMYVYIEELPFSEKQDLLLATREGILCWKKIDWLVDDLNRGVVANIKYYLPDILNGNYNRQHQFTYENGHIIDYQREKLRENTYSLLK